MSTLPPASESSSDGPSEASPDESSGASSGSTAARVETWQGDACSLVEAFRRGDHSPLDELRAVHRALEASELNAVSYVDVEAAELAARAADVSQPFGGLPIGVKELDPVTGWPDTEASYPLRERRATYTSTMVERLVARGGAVLAAQTTASEFGGVNLTRTVLHGVTRNPWNTAHTPGGSSGGSAATVAGGLLPIATAGDGGGSIRIPAGFCGLVGLKATYGRIPRSPRAAYGNMTVNLGCVSRSVRDTARWFDVCSGHDQRDPLSLAEITQWEAELGTHLGALRGSRVAVVPDWGGATVSPVMWELLADAAELLIADCGMTRVDGVDFIITASNPDIAFAAEGPLPSVFGGIEAGAGNNGLLTFPANLHGNPAVSIPAGHVDGLPVGLQVVGRHFSEPLLLDLALTVERNRPWPLTVHHR